MGLTKSILLSIGLGLVSLANGARPALNAEQAPRTVIRLGVLESFSVSELPSIERMRSAYESSLYYALGENEARLNKCGYSVRVATEYYDNADRLAPKERATYLENSGVHIILGPRRSEQFLVASHGVLRTPLISTTASSDEVHALSPPFFTMYPPIEKFSQALLMGVAKEQYGNRYGTLVDVTCLACRDFDRSFDKQAVKSRMTKLFGFEVAGEKPDLKPLLEALRAQPIDFLFLPIYAKSAGYVMAALQTEFPRLKYVGTHSWGDGAYGLLEDYRLSPNTRALAVNGNASPELMGDMFQVYALDREARTGPYGPPASAYRVIDFIRNLTAELCKRAKRKQPRLRNKEEFYQFFSQLPRTQFQENAVFGIFRIENSDYQFAYRVKP